MDELRITFLISKFYDFVTKNKKYLESILNSYESTIRTGLIKLNKSGQASTNK